MIKLRRIVGRAEEELDRHTDPPYPGGRRVVPREPGDARETLREEQVAETAEPLASSGPPHMTHGQWRGMLFGGLAGGIIGALLFLPVALVPFMASAMARVLVVVIVGWLAGATAGAVYWGGRTPELEGEAVDVNGRPSIGTAPRSRGTDERGRPDSERHEEERGGGGVGAGAP